MATTIHGGELRAASADMFCSPNPNPYYDPSHNFDPDPDPSPNLDFALPRSGLIRSPLCCSVPFCCVLPCAIMLCPILPCSGMQMRFCGIGTCLGARQVEGTPRQKRFIGIR